MLDKASTYVYLRLNCLIRTSINYSLLQKVCILRDHIYDLKIPKQFRFDIISPKLGSLYFILYNRAPTVIDEAINQLCLGRIDTKLYNYDNT